MPFNFVPASNNVSMEENHTQPFKIENEHCNSIKKYESIDNDIEFENVDLSNLNVKIEEDNQNKELEDISSLHTEINELCTCYDLSYPRKCNINIDCKCKEYVKYNKYIKVENEEIDSRSEETLRNSTASNYKVKMDDVSNDQDPLHNPEDDRDPNFESKKRKLSEYFNCLHDLMSSSTQAINIQETDIESNTQNETDPQIIIKIKNSSIFDGKFYEVVLPVQDVNKIEAVCRLCWPLRNVIKGSLNVTTNFIKHMKTKHNSDYEKYIKYKTEKRTTLKHKFPEGENQKKIKQTAIKNDFSLPIIPQKDFECRIINFIINTIQPINILENKSFIDLFTNMNVKVMPRNDVITQITSLYENEMESLKNEMKNVEYFCITIDIWSGKRYKFLGVTCHWITHNLTRKSVALVCKRFSAKCSDERLRKIIKDIHIKYNLNSSNIFRTVTDNGSNFLKDFKEFGVNIPSDLLQLSVFQENRLINNIVGDSNRGTDSIPEMEMEDLDIPVFETINPYDCTETTAEETSSIFLTKHMRCSSYTLNLIATEDFNDILKNNTELRNQHMCVMNKCSKLWNKAGYQKSAEIIQETLGYSLSYPGVTRWNSIYDSIVQILKSKDKLTILMEKLNMNDSMFDQTEILYIEEYVTIMKPLIETIDFLHGEVACYFGYLIPCLISLKNKWEKLKNFTNLKQNLILNECLNNLVKRFSNYFAFENVNDAIIASVTHPKFKTRWVNENTYPISMKKVQVILREAFDDLVDEISSDESDSKKSDDFFDFEEDKHGILENKIKSTNKFELEFFMYLEDKRTDLKMLMDYPNILKLFMKYNTPLPSSGSVERLFSFANIINTPDRHSLSDANFEYLVLLKANNVKM